jgi:integrase
MGFSPEEVRVNGKRRAWVHDFHSFRVTWITLALAAGVPLELVQRVTGHRTVLVVLRTAGGVDGAIVILLSRSG